MTRPTVVELCVHFEAGLVVGRSSSLILAEAARLWLRILEGDEQTVEPLAIAMHDAREARRHKPAFWIEQSEVTRDYYRRSVRAVLAALAEGEKQ